MRSMMLPLTPHTVLGHSINIEACPAVTDEYLDGVLIDFGVDVDLVGARVLRCIDHRFARGAYQGLDGI